MFATVVHSLNDSFLPRSLKIKGKHVLLHRYIQTHRLSNFDMERVRANLELATDVYIDRVNGCTCGD